MGVDEISGSLLKPLYFRKARRFVPAQESGAWSVKELPGVAYRTRWSRVAEIEGVWRAVETGVYEPFGPSGMPASSGR